VLNEQRLRTDEMKEHIFALAESHGADRTRVLDLGRDVEYLLQQSPENSTTRGRAATSPGVAAPKAHEERMAELRRDLEAHASRHEERLDAVERSLSKVYGELFALRRSLEAGNGTMLDDSPTATGAAKGCGSDVSLSTATVAAAKADPERHAEATGKTSQQAWPYLASATSGGAHESEGQVMDRPAASTVAVPGSGPAADSAADPDAHRPEALLKNKQQTS